MAKNLKIFAPTTTATWDFCHLKHELQSVERWVPKSLNKRGLSMYVGRAFADAMACLNLKKLGQTTGDPLIVGPGAFLCEIEALRQAGVEVEQQDVDEVAAALKVAVEKYLPIDPLTSQKGWVTQDVERTLPDHGYARIDWGGLDPTGELCQVDYKLKMRLDARYYDKTVEEYRYSPQMMHYNWGYGAYKQQPIHRYYICLVVLEPRFHVAVIPYEIDPELSAAWLRSAQQKWEDMNAQEESRRIPDMAYIHRDAFGDCTFSRACLEYRLDPTLMVTQYVQLPKRANPEGV